MFFSTAFRISPSRPESENISVKSERLPYFIMFFFINLLPSARRYFFSLFLMKLFLAIEITLKAPAVGTYTGAAVKKRHDSLLLKKVKIPSNGHVRHSEQLGGLPGRYLPFFPYDTAKLFPTGNSRQFVLQLQVGFPSHKCLFKHHFLYYSRKENINQHIFALFFVL